jgi:hypothetical protein
LTSDIREMASTRAAQRQMLDSETAAVANWLLAVCRSSDLAFDQVFIFRRPSIFRRIVRFNASGEIKAIGMPDLTRATVPQFRMLMRLKVITPTRGHWPGKWFKVNADAILLRDGTS